MSTNIVTSNSSSAQDAASQGFSGIDASMPEAAGLLDPGKLASWANALFRSLPGAQPELPPDPVTHTVSGAPLLEPDLKPAGTTRVPHGTGASAGHAPSASDSLTRPPADFSPATPTISGTDPRNIPVAGVAVPSSPYYFLAHGNELPAAPAGIQPVPLDKLLTPQSAAYPDQDGLDRLLQDIASTHQRNHPGSNAGQQQPVQGFYFLDDLAGTATDHTHETSAFREELAPASHPQFNVNAIRRDFPILQERVNGHQLAWFDNGATTQKPNQVIDRISYFYRHENSNIHRAAHELAARSTDAYEGARDKVARFLGAASKDEIVFVRGATEGINLVANTFGRQFIGEGDEIIVSLLEHHANIVPWQLLARSVGARIRVIPVDDSGQILLDEYQKLLSHRTKLVAITQVSNALGTVTPIPAMIEAAHRYGAKVLVDGAQSVAHLKANVQAIDADFFVFSGHKVFGPTGIGAVYGKLDLLNQLPPWQGGGNMISDVTFERTLYHDAPTRFEAGTGNIADAVGLGAAVDYVQRIGIENIAHYEHELLGYATQELLRVPGLKLIGTAKEKASVLSLTLDGYSNQDVGVALNQEGIAVRTGHHCAQPILRRFGLESTVRPTLALYNTCEEVDRLVAALNRIARGQSSLRTG